MKIMMGRLLSIPVLFAFSMGIAHAEPLDETSVTVLKYNGVSATVEMTWNHDGTVAKYETGCVSCMPNTSEFTYDDSITLDGVTPFPNTTDAMLYLIAYDSQDNVIHAEQLLVNLEQ
jgi:hypothetical protein